MDFDDVLDINLKGVFIVSLGRLQQHDRKVWCDAILACQLDTPLLFTAPLLGRSSERHHALVMHCAAALCLSQTCRLSGRCDCMTCGMQTCQEAAKQMVRQNDETPGRGGSIITMSSVNACVAIPNIAGYNAAKGGVSSLTRYVKPSVCNPVHGTERCQITCTNAFSVNGTNQRGGVHTLSLSDRFALPELAPPQADVSKPWGYILQVRITGSGPS